MAAADMSIGSRLDWINRFINLHNNVDTNIRAGGLNITQARILFYIATHEPRPIGTVGSALFLKPSTITASTNRLVDEGYVSRSYDELDRRTVYLNITEKGLATAVTYFPAIRKAFEEDCPCAVKGRHDELRRLLLPPSSHVFFGAEEQDLGEIAARIASDLHLDQTKEEVIVHVTRLLVVESISYFLARMAKFDASLQLTPNEARILRMLGNGNTGLKLKDMSALINVRPNVASLSIRTLTDNGLVERTHNKKDRRAASLKLTRKGARLMRDSRDELCEIFDSSYPQLAQYEVSDFFDR